MLIFYIYLFYIFINSCFYVVFILFDFNVVSHPLEELQLKIQMNNWYVFKTWAFSNPTSSSNNLVVGETYSGWIYYGNVWAPETVRRTACFCSRSSNLFSSRLKESLSACESQEAGLQTSNSLVHPRAAILSIRSTLVPELTVQFATRTQSCLLM